jgi:hypothetical protein
MTNTEDRLADALAAVARGVREETLPPLPARSASPGRRRRARWLAPLAAAAGVTIIVVLAAAIPPLFSSSTPGGEQTPGLPRYYATVEQGGVFVRDTATGTVTAKIPNKSSRNGSFERYAVSVAAANGGREFVAAYTGTIPPTSQQQTELYSFHLTTAGRVTGLSLVKGGQITGLLAGAGPLASKDIAVSPDGSKVALALYRPLPQPPRNPRPAAEIVVVNLRTGTHGLWQGGLQRPGLNFNIPSIAWQPSGNTLVFLARWCHSEITGTAFCQPGSNYAQVRTLRLGAGGGPLTQGNALLSQSARYPNIVQALPGPNARSLIMVILRGPDAGPIPVPQRLQVIQVPLSGSEPPRLLYHGPTGGHIDVFLGADASGRHLLLAWQSNGWIDHGVLHPLPPQGGAAFADAW